jgi:hypothetical protein
MCGRSATAADTVATTAGFVGLLRRSQILVFLMPLPYKLYMLFESLRCHPASKIQQD